MNENKQQSTFGNYYEKPLTKKEIFNMEQNLVGFFELLLKIERRNPKKNDKYRGNLKDD